MTYVYEPPILTVDCVIFQIRQNELQVLLIQRAEEPFKGKWALPGGYNAVGRTTLEALEERVLQAKVGLSAEDFPFIEQLYAFDTVARDPRGHAVSITYMALGQGLVPPMGPKTQNPVFHPVKKLDKLAFDHKQILDYAVERLRARITTTTAIFALLPKHFTLTQLQQAYEAILGRKLDKRNFRKKFLSFDILDSTDEFHQEGAHRPALLYRFKQQKLQPLDRTFA